MKFIAVFQVPVGGAEGVALAENVTVGMLAPIEVVIDKQAVRVVPRLGTHTEEDYIGPEGEPVQWSVEHLDALQAEVKIDSEIESFDDADIETFFSRPRRAALEAFRRTLSHLRSVTRDVSVNVAPYVWHAIVPH